MRNQTGLWLEYRLTKRNVMCDRARRTSFLQSLQSLQVIEPPLPTRRLREHS